MIMSNCCSASWLISGGVGNGKGDVDVVVGGDCGEGE